MVSFAPEFIALNFGSLGRSAEHFVAPTLDGFLSTSTSRSQHFNTDKSLLVPRVLSRVTVGRLLTAERPSGTLDASPPLLPNPAAPAPFPTRAPANKESHET